MNRFTLQPLLAGLSLLALASGAWADSSAVEVRLGTDPTSAPFPSNRWTVFDGGQRTLRRINLPAPDCAVRPSDCADVAVLNQLDGFSTQPRITIPFTGDIDPASVNSNTVYLLSLGDTVTGAGYGQRVGINQVVWDPATRTLAVQSDRLLQQHTHYLLVVTDGVRDAQGRKIRSGGWGEEFGNDFGRGSGDAATPYRTEVRAALRALRSLRRDVVAASLFTTQSITADLQKINQQIKASAPVGIDFAIGSGGVRAVFPTATLQGIQFARQTGAAPSFSTGFLPTPALNVVPGAVGTVAYGRMASPDFRGTRQAFPAVPSLAGTPQPQAVAQLVVQVMLPSGPKPAGGWPVALFGHGFTDSMYGAPWTVASVLASRGIATVSLNVVGHGGGAAGTLTVLQQGQAPVMLPAGGRGIDQDGNGSIDSTEGVNAAAPLTLLASRDGLRQTVVDYMQLVRQIEAGVDVDGDGSSDLNPGRIYYAGQSFGGIYGTILLGTEPSLRAGVPNVPGGSITEIARLSPAFRVLTGLALLNRQPTLLNLPPSATLPVPLNFNENLPLRNLPPLVNGVAGAMDIQAYLDRAQWATQPGNPVSYAPHIRLQPLPGHAAKPVIVQFARGDITVPNPTSSALVRAGQLGDRVTYFRNDLAFAANAAVPRNPHTFLTNIGGAATVGYAVAAQTQIALFFASDGQLVIDPDGTGPFFEVPIAGALPEGLNFLP